MIQDTAVSDLERPLTPRALEVVSAAREEFAAFGYAGATTDAIARRAGVSQPYVVRLFGSKERLFLRCALEAHRAVMDTFRQAIASTDERPVRESVLGAAYHDLVEDGTTLKLIVQQNSMGDDKAIGPVVRAWFLEVYGILRHEAQLSEVSAREFLARGMLINQLLALGLTETEDPGSKELLHYLAPTGERPAPGR